MSNLILILGIRVKKIVRTNPLIVALPIALICLLNPIWVVFFFDTKFALPDTFSYIAQSVSIRESFQFHTGAFGHIDNSLILPPLYPLLISFFSCIGLKELDAAILISQLSGFLFSIGLYLYMKPQTGFIISVFIILSLQLTYIYFNTFTTALTEPPFLAILIFSIILCRNLFLGKLVNIKSAFYLGILCALCFFCREMGVVMLLTFFLLYILYCFICSDNENKLKFKKLLFVSLGFAILFVPYQIVRFAQTGQSPLVQSFRFMEYVVESETLKINESVEYTGETTGEKYLEIYKTRRKELALLPDSSETLSQVIYINEISKKRTVSEKITQYIKNIISNLINVKNEMGVFLSILFLLSNLSLMITVSKIPILSRAVIPIFVAIYILLISVFTGLVVRYVEILIPLIIMHICVEFYIVVKSLSKKNINLTLFFCLFFPGIIFASDLNLFYEKRLFPKVLQLEESLVELRKAIDNQPVFTQFASSAYYVGGRYIKMPNDTLEKVARYGAKTKTPWILTVDIPEERWAMQLWEDSYKWMQMENLEVQHPELIEFCCSWHDDISGSSWKLYKIIYSNESSLNSN